MTYTRNNEEQETHTRKIVQYTFNFLSVMNNGDTSKAVWLIDAVNMLNVRTCAILLFLQYEESPDSLDYFSNLISTYSYHFTHTGHAKILRRNLVCLLLPNTDFSSCLKRTINATFLAHRCFTGDCVCKTCMHGAGRFN